MKLKEELTKFLNGKTEVSLKDIYLNFSDFKKESIRATLNSEIKKDKTFKRVKKGTYALK